MADELKRMKECLIVQVQNQMGNLQSVDTKEMGEVIDMIKDLEESIYYCTIVEAMEGNGSNNTNYYHYRDMDQDQGRMYYSGGNSQSSNSRTNSSSMGVNGNTSYYSDWRDAREGRSPMMRRTYMESKEMHKDKNSQIQELEKYTRELSTDMIDMIRGASPEEKQILQRKLNEIASQIMNV